MSVANDRNCFRCLLRIYVWLLSKAYGLENINKGEIKMSYIVKADNPDVGFSVSLGEVTDSEGNPIPEPQLSVEILSTDENVVKLTVDESGRSGSASFGSPGIAAVTVEVKDAQGNVLGSGGDNFTVTTGDPSSITSVSTKFEGLTPADEAPVEEPI